MLFEDINPFVRQAIVGHLNKFNTQDVHTKIKTVDCRMFYIISGSGMMTIEGAQHPLIPGTVILFPAGTEYIWEIEDVKYYSINFDYTHNFSHIKQTFHPIHSYLFNENQIIERPHFEDRKILNEPIIIRSASYFERTMQQITSEYSMIDEYTDLLLTSLLKSVIITIVRGYANKNKLNEQPVAHLVQKIIEFINTHYESPITNEDIAKHFNFNSGYLNRIFKQHTKNNIHGFLISCRISAAMEMLRSQNIPVCEVALKCGFQSLHHFTKTFKKHVEMTPTEYRNFNL